MRENQHDVLNANKYSGEEQHDILNTEYNFVIFYAMSLLSRVWPIILIKKYFKIIFKILIL